MSAALLRQPEYAVDQLFLNRWSSRAFGGEPIPDDVLFGSFEAARWAPSGGNSQPWRFIYSKRASESWPAFLGVLNERNRSWAHQASVLIAVLSAKVRDSGEGPRPLRSHSFDAGAAWSNFAHQALLLGWSTRAMGGFDQAAARRVLEVPEDYDIEAVVALGKRADKSLLPQALQDAEQPNGRLALSSLVAEGRFAFD